MLLEFYLASLLRDITDYEEDKDVLTAKRRYAAARDFGEWLQLKAGK